MARTERALRTGHLVDVANALRDELKLDLDGMRALRLPVDLLDFFPHWQTGSRRGFRPHSLGVRLLPDAADRPLRGVRLQLSPAAGGIPLAITLLRHLRRELDPTVRLFVFVDPALEVTALRRAMSTALGGTARVRFVSATFSTIFARDNAIAARDSAGRPTLVVPRRMRGTQESDANPLDRRAIRRELSVRVVSSRFDWQGGNVLFDGYTLAVGADVIAENAARLGLSHEEIVQGLSTEFSSEVTILGDARHGQIAEERHRMKRSGQASYHVDLDVALIGQPPRADRPVALVAESQLGLQLLPTLASRGELARPPYLTATQARAQMDHEYRAAARERRPWLRLYRQTLRARGYRIVDVPELRTRHLTESASGLQDLVYCNVLPGSNRGRPALHYLPTGVSVLDAAALHAYKAAGIRPVRIARTAYLASAMMERAAGLRCFCGAMP